MELVGQFHPERHLQTEPALPDAAEADLGGDGGVGDVQLLGEDPEFAAFRARVVEGYIGQAADRIERERGAGRAAAGPPADGLARALVRMKFAVLAEDQSAQAIETCAVVITRAIHG
ncbi:hypothetical protein [Nonomuraea sp. NPDC003727]